MTSLAKLLARKQRLLERLEEGPAAHERDEIERLLAEIDEALALLDESGPGISGHTRHTLPGPRGGSQILLVVSNS